MNRCVVEMEESDLKEGDHIFVYRVNGAYSHHGIYVGGGKVVHFGLQNSSSNFFGSSMPMPSSSSGGNSTSGGGGGNGGGRVVMSCLECFLRSGSLHRYQYGVSWEDAVTEKSGTRTTDQSDPPETVKGRALLLLRNGFGEYDLLTNNCEVFALYCKTGRHTQTVPTRQATHFAHLLTAVKRAARSNNPFVRIQYRLESIRPFLPFLGPCSFVPQDPFDPPGDFHPLSALELQVMACDFCLE